MPAQSAVALRRSPGSRDEHLSLQHLVLARSLHAAEIGHIRPVEGLPQMCGHNVGWMLSVGKINPCAGDCTVKGQRVRISTSLQSMTTGVTGASSWFVR